MSILMSIIATYTALFPHSDFFVIFSLIFLYGISSVSLLALVLRYTVHGKFVPLAAVINLFVLLSSFIVSLSLFPQIFFSFMLTPLFKKPKFASTVGSMLTVVFGCLSLFTVLMTDFPQPLVWLLCLLSPSAFSIGIAQVTHTLYLQTSVYMLCNEVITLIRKFLYTSTGFCCCNPLPLTLSFLVVCCNLFCHYKPVCTFTALFSKCCTLSEITVLVGS